MSSTHDYIHLFKSAVCELLEEMNFSEDTVARHIHPDYTQNVDGKTLDYDGFVQHMKAQKAHLHSAKIRFINLIAQENIVSTIHEVDVIKKDGAQIRIKIIGHMTYEGEKLIAVDELTHVLEGTSQDKNIGSMT